MHVIKSLLGIFFPVLALISCKSQESCNNEHLSEYRSSNGYFIMISRGDRKYFGPKIYKKSTDILTDKFLVVQSDSGKCHEFSGMVIPKELTSKLKCGSFEVVRIHDSSYDVFCIDLDKCSAKTKILNLTISSTGNLLKFVTDPDSEFRIIFSRVTRDTFCIY
jgi:hypothetical protein